jgi:ABC-type transporter Mla subunit MlaD
MFPNNSPNQLPSLEKLINRISTAERGQQKEIRISIAEAKEIITDLATMTSKLNQIIIEIHQMLKTINDNSNKIEVKVDGGGFEKR